MMINRREAIKKLGLSIGFFATSPLLLGFDKPSRISSEISQRNSSFFSDEEFEIIKQTLDIILPKTEDSPSATQVGVHSFIDQYLNEVVTLEEQRTMKNYLNIFIQEVTASDPLTIISKTFSMSIKQEQILLSQIDSYAESMPQNADSIPTIEKEVAVYGILIYLREMGILAYFNSEYVGEEILAYKPIPGEQQGCIDLQKTTGGKAWSLS